MGVLAQLSTIQIVCIVLLVVVIIFYIVYRKRQS
jgi:hypothetical protein